MPEARPPNRHRKRQRDSRQRHRCRRSTNPFHGLGIWELWIPDKDGKKLGKASEEDNDKIVINHDEDDKKGHYEYFFFPYVVYSHPPTDPPNVCEAMANAAQSLANAALDFWRGDKSAALAMFDMSFSQKYLGNNGIGSTYWSAIEFSKHPFSHYGDPHGTNGFRQDMIDDPSGDQTHHYAGFQTAGINGQWAASTLHQVFNDAIGELGNSADIRLGDAAYKIGAKLREDPNNLFNVGQLIRDAVCAHQ